MVVVVSSTPRLEQNLLSRVAGSSATVQELLHPSRPLVSDHWQALHQDKSLSEERLESELADAQAFFAKLCLGAWVSSDTVQGIAVVSFNENA